MKVLITGGNGFIGRRVTDKLRARGISVRWASRTRPEELPQGVEHVRFDAARPEHTDELVEGCTHVIHLAAREDMPLLPPGDDDGDLMFETNVLGTEKLLAACLKKGIKKVVVVTSVFTAGYNRSDEPNEGTRPYNVTAYRSPYVLSRFQEEYVCLQYAARGLPVIIAAPSIVVGAGDTKVAGPAVRAAMKGIVWMVPPGGVNVIDVDDVAQGLVNGLERGVSGTRYPFVASNVAWVDFFGAIAREVGVRPPIKAPPFLVKLGLLATRFVGWLQGRKRAFGIGAQILNNRFYFSPRRAIEDLGLPQTPVSESLKQTVVWVKTGKLPEPKGLSLGADVMDADLVETQKTRSGV